MTEIMEPRALGEQIAQQRQEVAQATARLKELEAQFSESLLGEAAAEFNEAGKGEGEVTFYVDGVKAIAEARKTVKWDSNKLKALAGELPWPVVERLFDIKFSMKEATYKAVPDDALLARINEARTTKVADLKVKFIDLADE